MNSTYTPDWEAYGFLQESCIKDSSLFRLEAADAAMDSMLLEHSRKATGKQLAKDLFRDGKRKAKSLNVFIRPEESTPNDEFFSSYQKEQSTDDQHLWSHELLEQSLVDFFRQLTQQQRGVLVLTLSGLKSTNPAIQSVSGVGSRQIRAIISQIRALIHESESTRNTFHAALYIIGFTSIELIDLIESL